MLKYRQAIFDKEKMFIFCLLNKRMKNSCVDALLSQIGREYHRVKKSQSLHSKDTSYAVHD